MFKHGWGPLCHTSDEISVIPVAENHYISKPWQSAAYAFLRVLGVKPLWEQPLPRPNWSRALPRPLDILDEGKEFLRLTTLADVRDFLKHIPKERRQFNTWQHVEATLKQAATGGESVGGVIRPISCSGKEF
jgi:hypothetical protein